MARYGQKHSGGRKTKAEEMGLEKRLNEAFKAVTNGQTNHDGATEILSLMWMKAIEQDYKAIEWISNRFYGKEPKAIIQDTTITHQGINIEEILNTSYEPSKDQPDISSDTSE